MSYLSMHIPHFVTRSKWISCGYRHISWTSKAVRSTFVNFFKDKEHDFVPSSSVIPPKGEGTYFTNAGMNQFKPLFLGQLDPTSKLKNLMCAVNSQKCIRVGGKHNDLEDVGHDFTHHTFFEMLGNWSFGYYFKLEACQMAYDLLTKQYGIPVERLYFTYFGGDERLDLREDEECKHVWLSLGIPKDRVLPFGAKDNFWDMGATGPCGPCTEIHYDHEGGRHAGSKVNSGAPDVVEIWNLVFIQYNRQTDQSLEPLPNFHVDTGMGLERMTAVLNETKDNYQTDLFMPLMKVIQKQSGCPMYKSNKDELNRSYRILADHARMFTVAISDGLLPSNDNLGHKLRTILHQCIHLCRDVFNVNPEVILPSLASSVIEILGDTYPGLADNEQRVCEVVKAAIVHHDSSREAAMKSVKKMLGKFEEGQTISGEMILALESGMYGSQVPLEMITEQARMKGLTVDVASYEKLVADRQANVSISPLTSGPDRSSVLVDAMITQDTPVTQDDFKYHYTLLDEWEYDFSPMIQETAPCEIQGLCSQGQITDQLTEGHEGEIILDRTCFYAEAGGQEADTGQLISETGEFLVTDVQQRRGYVVHYGEVARGSIQCHQAAEPVVSQVGRVGCMRNHTATHVLNSALTSVLPTTQQQGSSVTPHKFTFDFLALTPLDSSQVQKVEAYVRGVIKQEFGVSRRVLPLGDALKLEQVKTLQNENYPEEVSVITVGSSDGEMTLSSELCGGTHVMNTSHLVDFCITHLVSKSQNVKRMTCVTGTQAVQAHLNGELVQCMCVILQKLVEAGSVPEKEIHGAMSLVEQAHRFLDQGEEKLNHTLMQVSAKNVRERSRLQAHIEESNQAKLLWSSFKSSLDELMEKADVKEDIMKQLVTHIRKGQQLELLPKTVRDGAHVCLENLEHRVSEAVNKRGIKDLYELVQNAADTISGDPIVTLQADHIDINSRQMTKALLQQSWDKPVAIVQKSNRTVSIFLSLPSSSAQPLSKEDMSNIVEHLSVLGKAKGKLTAQKKVALYTFTVQGNTESDDVVQSLKSLRMFDR